MRAPVAALTGVLDRHEHRVVPVVDHGAAGLGVGRDREELLDAPAIGALEGHLVQRVGVADLAGLAVGRDPQGAVRVEGQVVRAGDGGDLLHGEAGEVGGLRGLRIAGQQQHVPAEGLRGVVAVVLDQLDDVAVAVAALGDGDRVGLIHLVGGAAGVVGQRDVDLAGDGVGLDVLGAIHLGGAHLVGREAGVDQHLLDGEARHQRLLAARQRDPGAHAVEGAVGGQRARAVDLPGGRVALEAGHVQGALGQQGHVVRLVAPAVPLRGDELVDVVIGLVVAGVHHRVAVARDRHGAGLVLEAAQRRVLDRGGLGILRVDLHDPAEAVGLVRIALVVEVEARMHQVPAARGGAGGDADPLLLGAAGADEVLVEVLLAREHRAPRGGAAGAVVQGAQHRSTLGVLDRAQQLGARGGAVHAEGGEAGDAAVASSPAHVAPGLALLVALEVHDRQAVRGDRRIDHVAPVRGALLRGEHDVLVGVLVVGHEVAGAVAAPVGDDVEVVAVVAELCGLRLAGLVLEVELGGVLEQRVAPADDRRPVVALGHGHVVDGAGDGVDRLEAELAAALGRVAVVGRRGCGGGRSHHDCGGQPAAQAQGGAARDRGVDDVAEAAVVGGVGDGVGAGAAALELAGDREAVPAGVSEHGQGSLGHEGVLPVSRAPDGENRRRPRVDRAGRPHGRERVTSS